MGKSVEIYNHPTLGSDINIYANDADELIHLMSRFLGEARLLGWEKLYFSHEEGYLYLMGTEPPNEEEIRKAKEKRRKQYERLKKEFEG